MTGTNLVRVIALGLAFLSGGVAVADAIRGYRRHRQPPAIIYAAGTWVRYQGQLARIIFPLFDPVSPGTGVYAVEWYEDEYGHIETYLTGAELTPATPTEEELTTWTIATLAT